MSVEQIQKGYSAENAQKYLKDWLEKRKKRLWKQMCNCKPKLENLLEIQQAMKQLGLLESNMLVDKMIGEKAREES